VTPAEQALAELDAARRRAPARLRLSLIGLTVIAFYVVAWDLAGVDPSRLAIGLPKLAHWIGQAWPPKIEEVPLFAQRTAETVAMAAIGTTFATLLAIPMAILASRNITPLPSIYYPARWFLNGFRGIDSFVFALLFVAAVGLGPFAGVLGICLHTWGSAAKLFADHIENANLGPFEAVRATGAVHLDPLRTGARIYCRCCCRRPCICGSSTSVRPPCSGSSAPAALGRN
jgi:phosphonate transport system permease protein